VSPSALDLGELGHELAAVDLAGDGLTLRVKAQPTRALAVGRNTVIGNKLSHGNASIVAPVVRQLPFVPILNVGLDLYNSQLRVCFNFVFLLLLFCFIAMMILLQPKENENHERVN
jgi:hypothetical protein